LFVFLVFGLNKVVVMRVSNALCVKKYLRVFLGMTVFLSSLGVLAQEASPKPVVIETARLWLNDALANLPKTIKSPLRMVLVLGELDSRLHLAPCSRVEPYLPVGVRLWGKARIGLRCLDGAIKWNVFLPITVHAFGPAWVVKNGISAGATLTEDDAMEAEVDWSESPSPILSKSSQWVGAMATTALSTGQVLRQVSIKPAQVFQVGAQVRVLAQGPGFTITSDGQAMSAGVVGQLTQVKMESGRILSGVVVDNRTVRVNI
jgi:flagellar basal body P-ring formation protein FlgA